MPTSLRHITVRVSGSFLPHTVISATGRGTVDMAVSS